MGLRDRQAPIKDRYQSDPASARITLRAAADKTSEVSCSVDVGRMVYEAGAHAGVGGSGATVCSGDLLLGALAACAQITCTMVAAAAGIPLEHVRVEVEGDLDLRGTLGMTSDARVGFETIRLRYEIDAPQASKRQLALLRRTAERYCTVYQTLIAPPAIAVEWSA
jgi:uncharacterized OsmC-like protein